MDAALLEARNLSQSARIGVKPVRDNSLYVRPGEVIALIGLGEGCANTLLDVLSGRNQPSEGQVLITGEDLYKKHRTLHPKIGFVPRGDAVHLDLTVFEALNYAARLCLPKGTARAARRQRVDEVLAELDLNSLRHQRVRALDIEQRKRVSIGMELITDPGLIFLEEPTWGFPLHSEVKLMRALRKLAGSGRALILTTQSSNILMLADRMAIILAGGYQAWFGPPDEALAFFYGSHQHSGENGYLSGFAEIFDTLGNASETEAREWAERYRAHPANKRYLSVPQKDKGTGILLEERPLARLREKQVVEPAAPASYKLSAPGQFLALSSRNLKVLLRDRLALILLLVAPLLAAGLDLVFSASDMYDPLNGSSERIVLSSAMLVFLAMLFGGFSWAREFRKEAAVFRRERQAALRIIPYVLSKTWIVALFALYQGLVWTGVHSLTVNLHLDVLLYFFITLASAALVGGMLGLLASALARSEGGAVALVFIFIIPQFLFSGWLRQISDPVQALPALRWANPSRMAFEALVIAGDHLQALDSDRCRGANLSTQCIFPGIGSIFGSEFGKVPPRFEYSDLTRAIQDRTAEQKELEDYERTYSELQGIIIEQAKWRTFFTTSENLIKTESGRFRDILNADIRSLWAALWISALVLAVIFAGALKGKDAR